MLEIDQEIFLPTTWKILEKSKYKIIGQLVFDFQTDDNLTSFGLRIFTYSDHEIIWN